MDQKHSGKTAIVTGGASGIGFETARRLLEEGAGVIIGDYNFEAAAQASEILTGEGFQDRIAHVRADVAQEADVRALVQAALARFGRLDYIFNNAGIAGAIGPITETEVAHWDETFAVMLRGVFLGVKHAARAMIARGVGGAIVNTASIAGHGGGVPPTAYSAAKAAVLSFTQNAANELAEHRIRVNAVSPGIIFTPLMHGGRTEQAEAVMREIQPWPERGEARDVANVVSFLLSEEARFITGAAIAVDGGYLANGMLRIHPLPGGKVRPDYAGITYGLTGKMREVRRLG